VELKKTTDPVHLYCLGDFHIGHVNSDKNKLWDHIRIIEKDPYALALITGDNVDGRSPRHKHFDEEQLDPSFQFKNFIPECWKYFKNLVKPIKNKLIGIHDGNHCKPDQYGNPYLQEICADLRIPYMGYRAHTWLKVFHRSDTHTYSYRIFSHHGHAGGRKSGSKINALEDLTCGIDADIYVAGHSHYGSFTDSVVERLTLDKLGKLHIIYDKKIYVNSRSYLKSYQVGNHSYGEKFAFKPQTTGCQKIIICPLKDTIRGEALI